MEINGTWYTVEILGYPSEVGDPEIKGYRLTEEDGTAHALPLVAGALKCPCGDYEFRRASRDRKGCKHCRAIRRHLHAPHGQCTVERDAETEAF
jgi:hypothetical protein